MYDNIQIPGHSFKDHKEIKKRDIEQTVSNR